MNGDIASKFQNIYSKAPLVSENQSEPIKLSISFRKYDEPEEGASLWDDLRADVGDCFSRQTRQCAEALWGKALLAESPENKRVLIKALWHAVSQQVLYTNGESGDTQYLFLLGSDRINDFNVSEKFGMAVIAGTTIALPLSGRYYYLNLEDHPVIPFPVQTRWIGYLSPIEVRKSDENNDALKIKNFCNKEKQKKRRKITFLPPACEYDYSLTAEEALFAPIKPNVAAWWHQQQENGGRRYIFNLPSEKQEVLPESIFSVSPLIRKKDFDELAIEATIEKWGVVISPETIRRYYEINKNNFNRHHRIFDAWHGGKDTLTLIDEGYHQFVSIDSDLIQQKICACLGLNRRYIPGPDYFEKLFTVDPSKIDDLCKIPNVTVKDGAIGINVLWPKEIFCIPSLMRFEQIHNGVYGPKDREPEERKEKQRFPVEKKEKTRKEKDKKKITQVSLSKTEPKIVLKPDRPKTISPKLRYKQTSSKYIVRALLSKKELS